MKLIIATFFILSLFLTTFAQTENQPHICKPEERGNHPCPLYYLKSCAWYFKGLCNHLAPGAFCGENAGNSCFACANPKVEKVTIGDCPQF